MEAANTIPNCCCIWCLCYSCKYSQSDRYQFGQNPTMEDGTVLVFSSSWSGRFCLQQKNAWNNLKVFETSYPLLKKSLCSDFKHSATTFPKFGVNVFTKPLDHRQRVVEDKKVRLAFASRLVALVWTNLAETCCHVRCFLPPSLSPSSGWTP